MSMPDKIMHAIAERVEALAVGHVMRRRKFWHAVCSACARPRREPMRFRQAAVAPAHRDAGNRRPALPGVTRSRCANSANSADRSCIRSRRSGGPPFWENEATGRKLNDYKVLLASEPHARCFEDGARLRALRVGHH